MAGNRRRRLIYRSRQRGWLEVDLLLGKWATENVPKLNAEQLIQCVLGALGWLYHWPRTPPPFPRHRTCLPYDGRPYVCVCARACLCPCRYEVILNCETIDLFYFISGQKPVPPALQSPVMVMLQEYAFQNPLGKADPSSYAKAKHNYSN